MNEFILRLLSSPSIGRMALNMEKNKALRPFQIPLSSMCEKQEVMLRRKLRRLGSTEIGRKLGVKNGINLEKLPITDYEFYAPFFSNPSPSAFMYPLEAYERIKTSGTGGKDKWFMIPRDYLVKSTLETGIPSSFLFTHNGKEIAIGYGDEVYVNTAPRPYVGSVMISLVAGRGGKFPLFNITPNQNIPFEDKVRYFIHNCERIDLAVIQASILVSRVMPEVHKNITLKGIYCPDSAIAEAYFLSLIHI